MVFGRKGVDDGGLVLQREHLARVESLLINLEQAAGRFGSYRAQFPDAWFESDEVTEAIAKIRETRELLEHDKGRLGGATSPIPNFDNDLDVIERLLQAKLVVLDSFAAVLIGRQHLLNARARVPGETFDPTVRECQQALHGSASQLADAVQKHIDELHAIHDKHRDIWPPNLDLIHLQNYLDQNRQTLDFYKEQLESRSEALPPESSISLLMLAQTMEQGVEMIEGERANLALAIITRAGLNNPG